VGFFLLRRIACTALSLGETKTLVLGSHMLPDLRIVIIAVVSTFVLTAGVGFYASSRMIQESKARTDMFAGMGDTPVNRIALSWPEPFRKIEQPQLDFAVTARALRNPVRDVTNESTSSEPAASPATTHERAAAEPAPQQTRMAAAEPAAQPARTIATEPAPQPTRSTETEPAPQPTRTAAAEPMPQPARAAATETPERKIVDTPPAQIEAVSLPAIEEPQPVPEPDIRIAVQYPPLLDLPEELKAPLPVAQAEPAQTEPAQAEPTAPVANAPAATDTPITTGSVAVPPRDVEAATPEAEPTAPEVETATPEAAPAQPEPVIANKPDPTEAAAEPDEDLEDVPMPRPAPKSRAKSKAAKKAPAKAKRPAAPRRVVRQQPTASLMSTPPFSWLSNAARNATARN
jgi:hypothetical protein